MGDKIVSYYIFFFVNSKLWKVYKDLRGICSYNNFLIYMVVI